jgi:NAD(P)-dependent dehydrogenase (short-subunit alcohol dehydrogenase family)
MSKTDALLYAQEGIRVNSVHPGFIWTSMVEGYLTETVGDLEEGRKMLDEAHPVGHPGEPTTSPTGCCTSPRMSRSSSSAPS